MKREYVAPTVASWLVRLWCDDGSEASLFTPGMRRDAIRWLIDRVRHDRNVLWSIY